MSEFKEQAESYAQCHQKVFDTINNYNTKIISFGFVAFFAMATQVKDVSPRLPFMVAIIFMSLSIAIFVMHELVRTVMYNNYVSGKSKAFKELPDNNFLSQVENSHAAFQLRFQAWNNYFFYPSLACGSIALAIIFYCYLAAIIC